MWPFAKRKAPVSDARHDQEAECLDLIAKGWVRWSETPPPSDLYVEVRQPCLWHDVLRANDLDPALNVWWLVWRPVTHEIDGDEPPLLEQEGRGG